MGDDGGDGVGDDGGDGVGDDGGDGCCRWRIWCGR